MKNIFKLLGIAFVACSMMVACGGDDPVEPSDTTNNGNNNNPPAVTRSYKITFNGNTWEPGVVRVYDHTTQGYITVTAIYDAEDAATIDAFVEQYAAYIQAGILHEGQGAEKPYVSGFLESTVGQSDYQASQGDCMTFYDATQIYTVTDTVFGTDDTLTPGSYYRWNAMKSTFTENITAVDLNALTMSCTWSENCFNLENYANNNLASTGDLVPLTGEMKNYQWTWYTTSK